ncbi:MAG: efflux RND transporter permease subunit, partial [Clostridia bacterium]|nr:efflux RND transporter permease subunit [Clostridia bacterium]
MFSKYSVKKPYTVIVGIIMVIVLGVISFQNMTTDLLPSMDLPYVVVYTTYIGATPEQVEQAVTRPMESSFATLTDIKNLTSSSMDNVSMVVLEFNEGANMDTALIEISSKVDQLAGTWDDAIGAPVTMKLNPNMLPVAIMAVNKEEMDIIELSEYVEDELIPQFEAINGVASASASGLIERRIDITIEQSRIDVLNNAILSEVDKELAEAERQLNDAQAQISDGKQQLSRTKKSTLKQIDDGIDAVEEGAQQIQPAIDELTKKRAELLAQRESVQTSIQQLEQLVNMSDEEKAQIQAMEKMLAELKQQKADLEKKLEQAGSVDQSALIQQRDEAAAEREKLADERRNLESYIGDLVLLDEDSLKNAIAKLESEISDTESEIASASSNLAELNTRKEAAEKEISDLKARIESLGGDPSQPPLAPPAAPENTPSSEPTAVPEDTPSSEPTAVPESTPSSEPTAVPEDTPSSEPTAVPESTPSSEPTAVPEDTPSSEPTA